jgi:hypothetical protein
MPLDYGTDILKHAERKITTWIKQVDSSGQEQQGITHMQGEE